MALLYGAPHARRSRSTALRAVVLVLVVLVCYHSVQPSHGVFQLLRPTQPGPASPAQPMPDAPIEGPKDIPGTERTERGLPGNGQPKPAQEVVPKPPPQPASPPTPDQSSTGINALPPMTLQAGLRRLVGLLPDELRTRDLLSPITGTGEAKIHEIGLRTRIFKRLFETWEAIHLVPHDEAMYQRDDIIQYLLTHPEVGHSLQMDTGKVVHAYEAYRSLLTRLSALLFPFTSPYFSSHMMLHASFYGGQRGLVFSASDTQALYMITSIRALRRLGCTLPIEVMYLGDSDLGEDFRDQLETIPGVVTRDLLQMVLEEGWTLAGWAGKPFALLLSSFREAIFVDADALFMRDPALLFEDPAYRADGALFFKDRLMMPGSKRKWMQQILPKPVSRKARDLRLWTGESTHMQESGVVVVDKWRHFVALLLVTRLNGPDRDGDKEKGKTGVYDMVYGDKETFWLGWELAGDLGYAFHDGSAAVLGAAKSPEKNETHQSKEVTDPAAGRFSICAPQLLHLDRDDRPLWFNGWLLPNKFNKEQHPDPVDFAGYIKEPPTTEGPGSWKLTSSNICCLTSDLVHELTESEKDVLKMIVGTARELEAL